jgi:hypothetical protein
LEIDIGDPEALAIPWSLTSGALRNLYIAENCYSSADVVGIDPRVRSPARLQKTDPSLAR